MTDDRDLPFDDGDDALLAGELALGLLTGNERAAALRRMLVDREFAAAVDRWRDHFGQLIADWPAVAPSDGLWETIDRRLDRREGANDNRTVRQWRLTAGLSSAAALIFAFLLVLQISRPVPPPPPASAPAPTPSTQMLIATLNPAGESGATPIAAIYDPARHAMRVAAAPVASAGHSAELWVIPADGVPRPMGVLNAAAATPMPIGPAQRPMLVPGTVLAVSIEPPGGSPTGKPTGPVVVSGTLASV